MPIYQDNSHHNTYVTPKHTHICQPAGTHAYFRPRQQLLTPNLLCALHTAQHGCNVNSPEAVSCDMSRSRPSECLQHTHCPRYQICRHGPNKTAGSAHAVPGLPRSHITLPTTLSTLSSISQRQVKVTWGHRQHANQLLPLCSHCWPALYTCKHPQGSVL
jgi:hypothetical protein